MNKKVDSKRVNMKKLICMYLVLLMNFSLIGKDQGVTRSIEWQKVELQEKISKKISKGVGAIINENEFIVEVDLAVSIPPAPEFNKRKVYQARANDAEFEQAKKDYIVFSKLGLEVPVLGKEENVEKEKLKDIWKFNEANDIFKNLDSVTIFLYLDKKLTAETVESVKTILGNLKLPIGDLTAEVEIEQINLTDTKPVVPIVAKKKTLEDYLNYVSKFSVMIGIILSTLLLVIASFLLFRKFKEMKENEKAKEMISSASQKLDEEKDEKERSAGEPMGVPAMANGEGSEDTVGIDRFRRFLGKSSTDASLLVKKWIKDESKEAKLALNALVQQLDNEQLFMIFESLTIEERAEWKGELKGSLEPSELVSANNFISNEIVADIIVPPLFQDQELIDTLLSISAEDGVKFVKENPDFGGVLMNIINTSFITDIMTGLDASETEAVIKKSLAFDPQETHGIFDSFKEALASYKVEKVQKPFVKRIIEIIPVAKPAMEESLYRALADAEEFEVIQEGAGSYFPSFLIENLTDNVLREIIQSYPISNKVELLSLDNGSFNVRMINLFAPEGTKARDHLDIEMQSIGDDITVQRKIKNEAALIWEEFVNHSRQTINMNKGLAIEVEDVVNEWINSLREMAKEEPSEMNMTMDSSEADMADQGEFKEDNIVEFSKPAIAEMEEVSETEEQDDEEDNKVA